MKLRCTRIRRLGKRPYFLLYPDGCPQPFWVDKKFLNKLRRIRWRYLPQRQRARGFFGVKGTRQYLHRYILALAGKFYPEVTFANGDVFDCRLVNLKPYRREEDGATRRMFKNNTSKRKGVCFHKVRKKWIAMIRANKKLIHLGYFDTADAAARAYASAFSLAHPTVSLHVP